LHRDQGVHYYSTYKDGSLGIPAISSMEIEDPDFYTPIGSNSVVIPKDFDKICRELSEVPIVSLSFVANKYGMSVRLLMEKLSMDRNHVKTFPFTVIPSVITGTSKVLISKSYINTIADITDGRLKYSKLMLDSEPIWNIAPSLFEIGSGNASNIVADIVKRIKKEDINENEVEDSERSVLIKLYERGKIVDFDPEKKVFRANNVKQLSYIDSIFNVWRGYGSLIKLEED